MVHLPKGNAPKTREEAVDEAEMIDSLADNETDDEVEYHRLRARAAALREIAAALREIAERLPS
jgi:hypothetical protein